MDYVIRARNRRSGKNAFGGEPGRVWYLKVPGNMRPRPSHEIKSKRDWMAEVMSTSRP